MRNLPGKWRGFLAHLGPYIIVISMLGLINLLTSTYPWFLWPALAWGVGLAFHLFGITLADMGHVSGKWRGFVAHLGSFVIVIGFLGLVNLLTTSYPWFLWPAIAWGAALAIHFWVTIVMSGDRKKQAVEQPATADRSQAQVWPDARPARSESVANATIQAHLDQARTYRVQIARLIQSTSDQNTHVRLSELAAQIEEWTAAIETLAIRIDRFERDQIIHEDLRAVPQSIAKLEAQLARETDHRIRADLEQALTNRRNQLAVLDHLQNMMKRAEIKTENTLSALGTIYSQLLTSQSADHVADYSRLAADVDEEVRTLQDHLEALEEVKLSSL